MSMTTQPTPRPNYTLTDAATLTGVSRSTIRRRREQGKFPDAFKTRDGEWMIPLTDLLANGLRPRSSEQVHDEQSRPVTLTPPPTTLAQAAHELDQAEQARLREELAEARSELAITRAKLEGTENTLAEVRVRASEVSRALLMIEQGMRDNPGRAQGRDEEVHDAVIVEEREAPATPPAPEPVKDQPRKKWWKF